LASSLDISDEVPPKDFLHSKLRFAAPKTYSGLPIFFTFKNVHRTFSSLINSLSLLGLTAMAKGLFAKKSIQDLREEAANKKDGLERSLSGLNLISMGIGAIVGAGVFVLVGQAAAVYAGPAVVLSFLFAALICVFAAFCYAEFASLIPIAGGAYSYSYATLGEIVAWTIGWGLTLEYLFSAATVAVGWSGYLSSFLNDFGVYLPAKFASAPLTYDIVKG